MNTQTPTDEENREYFRISGVVYLYIEKTTDNNIDITNKELPEKLDPLALRIHHFKSRLLYDFKKEDSKIREIVDVLEEMHSLYKRSIELSTKLPEADRMSVIISGSGLEFISSKKFEKNDTIDLHISFLEYPFCTVVANGIVLKTEKFGTDGHKTRYIVEFSEITEEARDNIIRYVNKLQRDQLSNSKKD